MTAPFAVRFEELLALRHAAMLLPAWHRHPRAMSHGQRLSPFKGRGMEYEESRLYQSGDDARRMDWRVTARTGRPHVKVFREEREQSVWLWVDYRPAMFFATRGAFKNVLAARIAALYAWQALEHGDHVGGWVIGAHTVQEQLPQRGRSSALTLFHHLAQGSAPTTDNSSAMITPNLHAQFQRVRPGSRVVMISDFRDLPDVEAAVESVSRHSQVVLCFLYDLLEQRLPPPGRYPMSDGARRMMLPTYDVGLAQAYTRRFAARQQQLIQLSRRCQARFYSCATTDNPLLVLQGSELQAA
ncbi:MAG TPA: DUF58 domain-containing protein [Gammaproteobacteria bacterium]|nr:DUF58 domain-containing protein [Gammaproteobacteria bacterium]